MINTCGYLIIEKRDELSFSQIGGDLRLCGGIILQANLPKQFPTCYRRIESFDSHFCDSWVPCNIQECIEEYTDFIQMHQNQLNKIKREFNK
mgnify:CR=1 FL=1